MLSKIFIACFLLFLLQNKVNGQIQNENLDFNYRILSEKYSAKLSYENHTAFKPYQNNDLNWQDSISMGTIQLSINNDKSEKPFSYSIIPVLNFGSTRELSMDSTYFDLGAGLQFDFHYKDKLYGSINYLSSNSSYPIYVGDFIQQNKVVPSMGFGVPTQLGYSFSRASGFIAYAPNKFFEFKAGVGKNFIGDGYRSLLLSDNAFQYPYFRINTTFWKLRYTNLFTMMDDIRLSNSIQDKSIKKFVSIHYLNWSISKRVSLGIFESVVWQAKDTLYNRQLDVNYFNPIIFYRPVEYSLGSSDNVLMGLNLKVKITNHFQFYSQFILDEFLLKEVLDGRGWWANKYGVQAGLKAIEPFKIKGLFIQTEFNVVRPFTYSHGSVTQNYGHYNQPLAHPLGSNFWEEVTHINYQFKNFIFSNQTNFALFGTDSTYLSYGGNIYQSYSNRAQEYYNRIGQGVSNNLFYNKFSVAFLLNYKQNLKIELAHIYRSVTNEFGTNQQNFIQISLKSLIGNSYIDF